MAPVPPPTNKLVQVVTVVVRTRSLLSSLPSPNTQSHWLSLYRDWIAGPMSFTDAFNFRKLQTKRKGVNSALLSSIVCIFFVFKHLFEDLTEYLHPHGTKSLYAIQEITALILQSYNTTQQPFSPFICYMSLDSVSSGVHILTPHGMIPSCYF